MSVSVMSKVMKYYQGAGGEYTLALCLADFANEMGDSIYPSVSTLAYNSRQSERTVQRQLKAMVSTKWLEIVQGGGGAGIATRYRISRKWLADPEAWAAAQPEGVRWRKPAAGHCTDFLLSPDNKKGDTSVTVSKEKRVTNATKKGDTAMSPEQEQNLSNNPPISPQPVNGCAEPSDVDVEIRKTAHWMLVKLRLLNPVHSEPNWKRWHRELRLMVDRDKRTLHEIRDLFGWANADPFWQTNILSPGKLRKQWDTLTIKRRASSGALGQQGAAADYRCVTHPDRQGRRSIPGNGWCCAECIERIEKEAAHV